MKNFLLFSSLLCFSSVLLAQSTVFPGDANANGIVDQYDVLSIGFAFGNTGPARIQIEDASTQGIAEEWPNFFPDGLNYIHADADGNGAVSMLDFFVWNQNFGITNGTVNELVLPEPGPATVNQIIWNNNQISEPLTSGESINVPFHFTFPVEQDINGVAFRLRFHANHFASASLNMSNNWLIDDGDGLNLQKNEPGNFAVGISRFGNNPINGGGTGGTLSLIVIDDMIALLEMAPDTMKSWLVLESVMVVDGSFEAIPIAVDSFELKLYRPGVISGNAPVSNQLQAMVYPNPSNGEFSLQSASPFKEITILDVVGRTIYQQKQEERNFCILSDLSLISGYYMIRLEGNEGLSYLPLMMQE